MSFSSLDRKKEKKWNILDDPSPEALEGRAEISLSLGVDPILAKLLWNRGCRTPDAAKAFLTLENEMLGDPFVMADMERAVERIRLALDRHEKITVYGDYDVDGVTSVTVLYLYLRAHGGEVSYFIPNRIGDGYGVTDAAVSTLADCGTSLIVTVDTGVTANKEVENAKARGVDFVITDHHECCSELPVAAAVLNPHRSDCPYPFKSLAGVGVVFKLLCALEERLSGSNRIVAVNTVAREFADLVAIGTIADVMPILDENKLIVKLGLEMIERCPRPSIAALIEQIKAKSDQRDSLKKKKPQKITSSYIGYTIAPRINAAGRIRSASLAVELLLSEDPERIRLLAEELCDANAERQEEENRIMRQAFDLIESEHDFARDPVIVLDSDEWHHGVIGIVSSRITEHYGLPSILVSFEGAEGPEGPSPDDVGKGSGRSVPGLNLVDALTAYQDLLVKYGGHELAAGLSIRRGDLPTFREKINEYARNKLSEETLTRTLDADCILSCSDLSLELAESIARMEPFGTGNPTPCFVSRDLVVSEITKISGGKHTRLLVGDGSVAYQAMCFGMTESDLDLYVGEKADLLYSLDINEYAGRRSLQLIVRDLHKAGASDDTRQKERKALELILDGQKPDEIAVPELTRRDFAAVYQLIRETIALGSHLFSLRGMISRLSCGQPGSFDYLKLQLILQIFLETHLITLSEEGEDLLSIRLCPTEGKIDLEKSKILSRVRMLASR